ncbi:MAG: NAD(P)-dependent oxidoreductase [Candidatus Bathyarchaeia archaeon]
MELLNRLKRKLPENYNLVIPPTPSLEEALPLVDDVDVIVGVRVPRKMIELARRLKMIQTVGVGADGVDIDAATEKGIVVCSSVGLNAIPVAEHAMSLILALAKNIARYDRGLRSEGWFRMSSTLLKKKTLGIIGLGSIGVEVAKRAKAFDMRIIAIKRRPSEELRLKLGLEFLGSGTDLPHIMAESDFVLVSIVLTPETRRMIGEKELRMMKKSAYLVNISRGGVIDESALVKALKEGTIAGAGLDVFEVEPIQPDNPLLKLENVILTPHVAGAVEDEEMVEERAEFIARNIVKAMNGLRPEKIVDPYLKYVVEREY